MAAMQISCVGDASSTTTTSDVPAAKTELLEYVVPEIACNNTKATICIEAVVSVDSAQWPPILCWLGIYEDLGLEPGDEVMCTYQSVSTSGWVTFDDVQLESGSYYAILGLSQSAGCQTYVSVDTSTWKRISVGPALCDSLPRIMDFQYDCQVSYNIQSLHLPTLLKAAFQPAQTNALMENDNVWLTDEVLFDEQDVADFINANYPSSESMYVAAIADYALKGPGSYGTTWASENTYQQGDPEGFSLLYVQAMRDRFSNSPFNWPDYLMQQVYILALIHELGHQRAGLVDWVDDPSLHSPLFDCVMKGIEYDTYYRLVPGTIFFCDSCERRIGEKTW